MLRFGGVVVLLTLGGLVRAESSRPDYLKVVRAYADAMIEHGRDKYGPVHSPLFAATLDRKTLRLPDAPPPGIPGIRAGDRTLTGANPMHDLDLYQVLYVLTKIVRDARYAAAADEALKWFFEHTQSPATGLFAWGEHLGWDFRTETFRGRNAHEFYRPWVLWERSFRLAPEPCYNFALGLWRHQIADQTTGDYSRHARYTEHGPEKGYEFPRHGGFYIATWASAYARYKDPELLQAIEALLASFEARRNRQSGALPMQTRAPLDWYAPQSELSLAIDLWDGAKMVPENLAGRMRAFAAKTDEVFLKVAHDLGPRGKGFVENANTFTLQPVSFTKTWETGYGLLTDSGYAMLCLLRYRQVKLDGYKRLVLATADRYLVGTPDTAIALYPGSSGDAMALLLGAWRLTGDRKYLNRAGEFGAQAVQLFFDNSALPRASTKHDHYEAITRADTLAMELLDLWAAQNKPRLDLGLMWPER